ncbi:MAG TPA: twin-arginine translocation signal domain-containing protein, partial [Acidobacteriota bacterium]
MGKIRKKKISRRSFIGTMGAGGAMLLFPPWTKKLAAEPAAASSIFHVEQIPGYPFTEGNNRHAGVEALLTLMHDQGLPFFRSAAPAPLAGP